MTRTEIVACLLAMICLLEVVKSDEILGDGLDEHRRLIQITRLDIQNKVRELMAENFMTLFDLQNEMWLVKEDKQRELVTNADAAFNNIQRMIEVATLNGKNVGNCLEAAKEKLGDAKDKAANALMKYINDVDLQYTLASSFLTGFEENAKTLVNSLNRIFATCYATHQMSPNCVKLSWAAAQPTISTLRAKFEWCKELRDLIVPWVTKSISSKMTAEVTSATSSFAEVQATTEDCVDNA